MKSGTSSHWSAITETHPAGGLGVERGIVASSASRTTGRREGGESHSLLPNQSVLTTAPAGLARFAGVLVLFLAAPLLAETLGGGQFTLNGAPVTTGGSGKSDGGNFAVVGGADATAATPLSGGNFAVTGGLVGVAVVPGEMTLDLVLAGGQATLSWPAAATGYVLQFTTALGNDANWQPVTPAPQNHTFTTPFNQSLRFFRLHKP